MVLEPYNHTQYISWRAWKRAPYSYSVSSDSIGVPMLLWKCGCLQTNIYKSSLIWPGWNLHHLRDTYNITSSPFQCFHCWVCTTTETLIKEQKQPFSYFHFEAYITTKTIKWYSQHENDSSFISPLCSGSSTDMTCKSCANNGMDTGQGLVS